MKELFPQPIMHRTLKPFEFNGFKYFIGDIVVITEYDALEPIKTGCIKPIGDKLPF